MACFDLDFLRLLLSVFSSSSSTGTEKSTSTAIHALQSKAGNTGVRGEDGLLCVFSLRE